MRFQGLTPQRLKFKAWPQKVEVPRLKFPQRLRFPRLGPPKVEVSKFEVPRLGPQRLRFPGWTPKVEVPRLDPQRL